MLLGMETFSYHLAFALGGMDIFGFMRRCRELGLDGVQINVNRGHLGGMGHMGGDDPGRVRDIRALAEELALFIELDTRGTAPEILTRIVRLCGDVGADVLRTYVSTGGNIADRLAEAPDNFREVMPVCRDCGVRIALENHEYETAREVLDVVRAVDDEHLGLFVDTGNSMMVWEDPSDAIRTMAPYGISGHFKDHVVLMHEGQPMVVGLTLGRGSMDCHEAFRIIAESPMQRINIEVCYAYKAPFRRPQSQGAGGRLGEGVFRVIDGPHDPAHVMLDRTAYADEQVLAWEDQSVVESVGFVQALNEKYG